MSRVPQLCILSCLSFLYSCTEAKLGIRNNPPLATITSHENESEVVVADVTMVGQVSDDESAASDLTVWWEQDGVPICEDSVPGDAGMTTCEATVPDPWSEFVLKVQDDKGAIGLDRIDLIYAVEPPAPTEPPTAEITAPMPEDRFYTDIKISFLGRVGDTEDEPESLEVMWTSDVDGELELDSVVDSDGQVTSFGYLSAATHALTLRVTDSDGQTGSDSVVVDVGPTNSAPDCAITTPLSDAFLEPGVAVSLRGTADDADQAVNTLSAEWESDRDGPLGLSTPTTDGDLLLAVEALSPGPHVLNLTVTDELEAVCSDAVLVTVGAMPAVDDVEISPDPARAMDVLTCIWSWLGDAGSDASTVSWLINDVLAGTGPLLSGGFVRDDTVTCTVTPSDGARTGTPQSDELVVVNSTPSIEAVEIEPSDPSVGDVLSCSWSGFNDSDADVDMSTLTWAVDGSLVSDESTLSDGFVGGNEVVCTVTPHDGLAAGSRVSASVTISDTPPVLMDASLTPLEPTVSDVLTCTPGLITDADGSSEFTHAYRWVVGGTDVGSDSPTLSSGFFARDQSVTCHVTPRSAGVDGVEVASNMVTVGNSAPSIDSVSITPDPATPADTLLCAWSGFSDLDDDTDLSTIEWRVDGVLVGTGVTLSGSFGYEQTVECTVTPSDGTDVGTPRSSAIVIANTPPEILSLDVSPTDAVTTSTLSASVAASDAEGDGIFLAYQWTVDGLVAGSDATSLEASWFTRDQSVRVMVTPSDAYGVGDSVSSVPIIIGNTPPGPPGVSIEPAEPVEGEDDLLCQVTDAIDADGDSLTYAVSWLRNDEPWEGPVSTTDVAGDTISAAETTALDVWLCRVTASDDVSDGPAADASVEIDNAITRVFVTSFSMNGDLGGPTGADELCTNAAADADLGGTWSAFLSGGGRQAITYIAEGPYHRLDGVLIAEDRAELGSGSIRAPINVDENGSSGVSAWVFTGSTPGGTVSGPATASGGNCVGWTQGCGVCFGDHWYAHVGKSDRTNDDWVEGGNLFCSNGSRLYCFED